MPVGISPGAGRMAQLLGCSRQRVNVELKAMERDGVIRMAQRGITILDPAQLEPWRSRKTRLEPPPHD